MSFREMSQTRLRAWVVTVVWTLAGAGFFMTFFSGGGAAEFATDSSRHLAGAVAIGFGFVGWWMGLWATRRRGGRVATDERDAQAAARASQVALVVVLLVLFAFTVGLWTFYEDVGSVPVGWMWFLAYSSVILAVVTNAVAFLVLDGRMGVHG